MRACNARYPTQNPSAREMLLAGGGGREVRSLKEITNLAQPTQLSH